MSLLTMFITELLDDSYRSIEIHDDNAKVPSEDEFVAAYDAGCSSCSSAEHSEDEELEATTSSKIPYSPSTSPASHRRPSMHYHDFKKQFHSPTKSTKRESRWDTSSTTLTLEKTLCTPRRCRSPSRGAAKTGTKQDLKLRMPLRSLAVPPKLAHLPSFIKDITTERPRDLARSTFDLVEEAIDMCNLA
jgi:hypothetical protein